MTIVGCVLVFGALFLMFDLLCDLVDTLPGPKPPLPPFELIKHQSPTQLMWTLDEWTQHPDPENCPSGIFISDGFTPHHWICAQAALRIPVQLP